MNLTNIRRAQLISPFGPGSLVVLRNGLSVIVAGLDQWFRTNENPDGDGVDRDEFRFLEWRLQRELGVDYFCLPPDFRYPPQHQGVRVKNVNLTIPALRFPTWHICRFCNQLEKKPLTYSGHVYCPECQVKKKKRVRMAQVRFIALCEDGHIQDFPWLEWVHRSPNPSCNGPLKLEAKGGSSLSSLFVRCTACNVSPRSLGAITQHTNAGRIESQLSSQLDSGGARYLCRGVKPWLGSESACSCQRDLVGGLRSATNVHFGDIQSAIYLPSKLLAKPGSSVGRIVDILRAPEFSSIFSVARGIGNINPAMVLPMIKSRPEVTTFKDEDLLAAIACVLGTVPPEASMPRDVAAQSAVPGDDRGIAFRRVEFNVLSQSHDDLELRIKPTDLAALTDPNLRSAIAAVNLVDKLRETRVFTGFSRLVANSGSDNKQGVQQKMDDLRIEALPEGKRWLPGYKVFGEGIFVRLNEERLQKWENRADVIARVAGLDQRNSAAEIIRRRRHEQVTPRLVLIHTLAHLLINRLTFECGYSSAALRERLFVTNNPLGPMAGMLIYTASGDSEGSLGGLVRMGLPGNLEGLIRKALEDAKWCSNDPVCMESAQSGQGPEGLNLAACHSCALLPETACERFNRHLDRGLVVGSFDQLGLGFFSPRA
jgi:hypothetical protein